jgi:hypothetical protein
MDQHRYCGSAARGVQDAQDEAYQQYEKEKKQKPDAAPPTRTVIIIEDAHEFLSDERIEKTKILSSKWPRLPNGEENDGSVSSS